MIWEKNQVINYKMTVTDILIVALLLLLMLIVLSVLLCEAYEVGLDFVFPTEQQSPLQLCTRRRPLLFWFYFEA